MAGGSSLTYLGHGLVLRRVDAIGKTTLTAIEQAIEDFQLFCRQFLFAVRLPESRLTQYPVDAR
ncbi:hypothetical protein D3C80_1821720 [compost metagenome]